MNRADPQRRPLAASGTFVFAPKVEGQEGFLEMARAAMTKCLAAALAESSRMNAPTSGHFIGLTPPIQEVGVYRLESCLSFNLGEAPHPLVQVNCYSPERHRSGHNKLLGQLKAPWAPDLEALHPGKAPPLPANFVSKLTLYYDPALRDALSVLCVPVDHYMPRVREAPPPSFGSRTVLASERGPANHTLVSSLCWEAEYPAFYTLSRELVDAHGNVNAVGVYFPGKGDEYLDGKAHRKNSGGLE